MQIFLKKVNQSLIPDDEDSAAFLLQCPQGQVLKADVSRPRNYEFHKKYFALLDFAFDCWEPEPVFYKGVEIEKNKETFRKNIQIMAGYGYPVVNLKNEVRYESKSISFGSMSAEEFEKLYSAVINVILKHVLTSYKGREELEGIVNTILNYD